MGGACANLSYAYRDRVAFRQDLQDKYDIPSLCNGTATRPDTRPVAEMLDNQEAAR